MKSYKRSRLLEMAGIVHRSEFLTEGEDEDLFGGGDDEGGDKEGGDDAGGEDLFGDDEEGDKGGDEEEEEKGDEEGGDEEAKEEPEEDPADELSASDVAKFGTGEIDSELDTVFMDIFDRATERATVRSQTSAGYPGRMDTVEENFKNYSLKILLEQEDAPGTLAQDFDMAYFADEIARYLKHYSTLLDIEGMIYNKARQFLMNKFDQETADEFEEFMAKVHGFDPNEKYETPGDSQDPVSQPVAVGASASAAGA